jgi:hypothetical protein
MQEHVKWNTAKEVDDYLDLRIKNKAVLMMKFYFVGVGWWCKLCKYNGNMKIFFQLFLTLFSLSHQERMLLVF